MSITVINGSFSPSVKVNGKLATANWSVKADGEKTSPRYSVTTNFDFSGCSNDEILQLALRSVVIETQRQFRELAAVPGNTVTTNNPFVTVNVKSAIVDATRRGGPRDNVKSAASAFSKMTPEQRADFLKSIGLTETVKTKKSA